MNMGGYLIQDERIKTGIDRRGVIQKIVLVFVLGYGLHYFGYFIRVRYYNWIDTLSIGEGTAHAAMYLGHSVFLIVMLLYALAVVRDRKYILAFTHGKFSRNLKFALIGAAVGFTQMAICVFSASTHGDLVIKAASGMTAPLILFSLFAVFLQASVEEIESRGFVFGKMYSEGVPLVPAIIVSAFYFGYLHAANPGFTVFALISIMAVGVEYAVTYYYFGTIWFTCLQHMMWNYTQDFIFGLPDSGKLPAVSFFASEANGSSFFYDMEFGIEGGGKAVLMNLVTCAIIILIGRKIRSRALNTDNPAN